MQKAGMFSIIIPTYNEAENIANTIRITKAHAHDREYEIIVVDGDSTDETMKIAEQMCVTVKSEHKGRAVQMNKGASIAKGDVLYFLHADSIPPQNFIGLISDVLNHDAKCGCFRLAFDHRHWFLNANAWFTRFNVNVVRFGDQSLFVKKEVFLQAGGFNENLLIMEDQEIIHRLKKFGKFVVLNDPVITSARKYRDNGVFRMQGIFYFLWALYYLGFSQEQLVKFHRKLIRKNKL